MRNLHAIIKQEYGWESIFLVQQWEKLEKKMSDFRNHRRFTIKCLKNDIVPVSVRLKTNIKTAKGLEIIKRAEKQLLNECVRSINNQLEMFMLKRDICINKLKIIIRDQNLIQECEELMKKVVESRHIRVLERKKSKYEVLHQQKLDGHSNQGHCKNKDIHSQACPNQQETPEETRKWVINLSNQPLTEKQEKLLAQGPKFVIKPK